MINYNFKLAMLSLKQRPMLTLLMVCAMAVGLGLLTFSNTLQYHRTTPPLPEISGNFYLVQLDNREKQAEDISQTYRLGNMTYIDAMNLITQASPASDQVIINNGELIASEESGDIHPLEVQTTRTLQNFFRLFQAPFQFGGAWSEQDDRNGAPVVVISKKVNQYFFGGKNSVGQQIKIDTLLVTVVGVLDNWDLRRQFFDRTYSNRKFSGIYMPFQTAVSNNHSRYGNRLRCPEKEIPNIIAYLGYDITGLQNSECSWINYWVKLESPQQVQDYKNYINDYLLQQKELGRFPRENNLVISNVYEQVAEIFRPFGSELFVSVSAKLFFMVCLLNSICILLAKFLGKSQDICLRRALGASKGAIIKQHLYEVFLIGTLAGILGIILSKLFLTAVLKLKWWETDYKADIDILSLSYQLDWTMISQSLMIAIISTLIIALYPIWHICRIPPAAQLKSA